MSLMWLITGAGIVLFVFLMKNWIQKKQIKLMWPSWVGIIATAFFAFFAFMWSISSIVEGENQAAGMGLIFFGGAALISFALTRRTLIK